MARKALSKLNDKQRRFCEEYLVDLNATQAAIRAGYSEKTAGSIGFTLLKKAEIGEVVQSLQAKRSKRTDITADKVLQELAKIGFSDIREAMRWTKDKAELIPSADISDEAAGAIAEVMYDVTDRYDDNGNLSRNVRTKVRLYDKRMALVDIGRHLGMFDRKDDDDDTLTAEDYSSMAQEAVSATAPSA